MKPKAQGAISVAQEVGGQHPLPEFALLRSDVAWKLYQFRVKLTRYSGGGFELTARMLNRERAKETYEKYGGFGAPRGARLSGGEPDPENIKRARYRRRTAVRQLAREKSVTHLLTLSTRQKENTRDELMGAWARFQRLYFMATGYRLDFIAVCERHPTNPGHLHMHVAVTSYLPVRRVRRLWYMALGGRGNESGAETPGGVHMREIRAKTSTRRSSRIARYLSDYMTKDTVEIFNKKAYTSSRGSVPESEGWWLAAETLREAANELSKVFGLSFAREDHFIFPGERGVFFQHVPGDSAGMIGHWYGDPPPF